MQKKMLWGAMGVLAVAVFGVAMWFAKSTNHDMTSVKSSQQTIQNMMGTANINSLPLKTATDQKPLSPTVKEGVKEFTLTAEPIRWQYANGKTVLAWAYNGQVPGPEIRVTEGDKLRITFTNKLPKATTVHWHGLNVPNSMDGVPGVTQDAIQPGKSFTYEFTATPAGTHMYHTHGSGHADEAQQSDMGLSGTFIVEPRDYQKPDKEYTLLLDDWQKGGDSYNQAMEDMNMASHSAAMNYNLFTVNGLAFPNTKPLNVKQGDKLRIRLINASAATIHPMHLHGHQFKVVAQDGNELKPEQQYMRNTIALNPGEIYDIEVTADDPGTWAFHCHELHHAGMGMVTLFKYEGVAGSDTSSDMDGMQMKGMHHSH